MKPEFERTVRPSYAGRIFSDVDVMLTSNCPVGFDLETESDIVAVVETDASSPGYLRLRMVLDIEFSLDKVTKKYSTGQYLTYWKTAKCPNESNSIESTWTGPSRKSKVNNDMFEQDMVCFFPCSKWPPSAMSWVDRARPSSWPSKDAVEQITSSGCRIVLANHDDDSSQESTEFRFSFSEAETILFQTMSAEQRQCFVAFKALVKYQICALEQQLLTVIKLKSYHLKTIFMWSCETIAREEWQTPRGWSSCLLFLLDQLHSCLTNGILPNYFIPEGNLFDKLNLTRETQAFENTLDAIQDLRSSPLVTAAEFVDSVEVFRECPRMFYINIGTLMKSSVDIQTLSDIFEDELKYLLSISSEADAFPNVQFQIKRVCFQILSTWSTKNTIDFQQDSFRRCLIGRITLFDLIYLDVEYKISFPEDIWLSVYNQELSANVEVLCRLFNKYNISPEEPSAATRQTNIDKVSRWFQLCMSARHVAPYTGVCCVYFLIEKGDLEVASLLCLRMLENNEEANNNMEFEKTPFTETCSWKTKNELREWNNLFGGYDTKHVPVRIMFYYLLIKCYLEKGSEQVLINAALERMELACRVIVDNISKIFSWYLLAESYEMSGKTVSTNKTYRTLMKLKFKYVEDYLNGDKLVFLNAARTSMTPEDAFFDDLRLQMCASLRDLPNDQNEIDTVLNSCISGEDFIKCAVLLGRSSNSMQSKVIETIYPNFLLFILTQSCPRVGWTRGSGRVGSGRVGSGRVTILPNFGGSGRVGSALKIFYFFTDYFLVPESI